MHGVANIHSCTANVRTYLKSRWATIRAASSVPTPTAVAVSSSMMTGASRTCHPGTAPNQTIITASIASAITKSNRDAPTELIGMISRGK